MTQTWTLPHTLKPPRKNYKKQYIYNLQTERTSEKWEISGVPEIKRKSLYEEMFVETPTINHKGKTSVFPQ